MKTEEAYQHVKGIVDNLDTTFRREMQWREIRAVPPRHMNLAVDPMPKHFGRVCRFRVGDHVRVAHQSHPRTVLAVHCHEVNPIGWSHCAGTDALYELDDGQQRGDHELSFAFLTDVYTKLPSVGDVHAVHHQGRLVGLTFSAGPLPLDLLRFDDLEVLTKILSDSEKPAS